MCTVYKIYMGAYNKSGGGECFKRNWDWDEFQVRWNRFLGSNIERNWVCLDVSMDSGLFGSYNYVAGIERNV